MDSYLIRVVISTLNDIEVRGRDNLDKLLGCINALDSIAKTMDAETAAADTEHKEDTDG